MRFQQIINRIITIYIFGDKTINHKKVKELGIHPERIRELINSIEEQQNVIEEVKKHGSRISI